MENRGGSNNTNKLSPQEPVSLPQLSSVRSNNTNKLSPQEPAVVLNPKYFCSNNTNKLSPQEPITSSLGSNIVQIIQINLVLKN